MQGQQAAGLLVGVICVFLIAVPIGALIAAVILRAACSIFNKLAGPEKAVPEPGFGKALGIAAATLVVNVLVGIVIGVVFGAGAVAAGASPAQTQILVNLISMPAGFLVMSGMLTAMLPTSFGRSLLIALIAYAVMIAIGVVVAIVIAVIGVGMMGLGK